MRQRHKESNIIERFFPERLAEAEFKSTITKIGMKIGIVTGIATSLYSAIYPECPTSHPLTVIGEHATYTSGVAYILSSALYPIYKKLNPTH